MRSNQFRRSG